MIVSHSYMTLILNLPIYLHSQLQTALIHELTFKAILRYSFAFPPSSPLVTWERVGREEEEVEEVEERRKRRGERKGEEEGG